MAEFTLPVHPRTGLTAVGVLTSGRVVWPVKGADDDADAKAAADDKAAADKAAADKTAAAKAAADDKGFPANTPVADMTAAQQAAYWQDKARKHEARVKAIGLTPEQIQELKDKADRHDALELELASDAEKAAAKAKTDATAEADAKYIPRLVRAEFRAALKGRIDDARLDERLNIITEPLDLSKFLNDSGDVDTDKVTAFVDGVAPAKGNEQQRRGPSPDGHGARGGSTAAAGGSVASGRDLYRERHQRKSA